LRSHLRTMAVVLCSSCVLSLSGCSSGGSGTGSYDPCPVVRWWADTTGNVSQPVDAPISLAQAEDFASQLPDAEGEAYLRLYNDLMSNMSDAAYAAEASNFEATYCK
jgi:hypothetical protein